MPYGVYTPGTAGEEVSSTYEGRHLTFNESQLTHPYHSDGFVDKGEPCLVGEGIVGVAFKDAIAATDLIALDTEGIWQISVVAEDEVGNSAVEVGDELFIMKTPLTNTTILSKNRNKNTHVRFGYALYPISAGGTDVIPVKVHFDPDDEVEMVGNSAAFLAMGTARSNGREYRYRSTKTSGDIRGQYMALALAGGASGEAHRGRTIVEVATGGGVHGGHHGLEIGEDGSITGLGVGHRATFMGPDKAHAGGTIAGGMSELWAEGDSTDFTDYTMHSIHRFVMDGDATGKTTAQNVFEFVDLSATQYAANTDTPDHALRCIINGEVRYIMVSEAQS